MIWYGRQLKLYEEAAVCNAMISNQEKQVQWPSIVIITEQS